MSIRSAEKYFEKAQRARLAAQRAYHDQKRALLCIAQQYEQLGEQARHLEATRGWIDKVWRKLAS
jgi:hypothetical protein